MTKIFTRVISRATNALETARNTPLKSLPLNLHNSQQARPAKPDVRNLQKPAPPLPTAGPLSQPRLAEMQARIDGSIDNLFGKTNAILPAPGVSAARAGDDAAIAHIDGLFGTPAADAVPPTLGARILVDVQKAFGNDGAQAARDGALMLARALRTVTGDRQNATRAWQTIATDAKSGQQALADEQRMNQVLRAIASNALAFEALWQVKQANGHAVTRAAGPEPLKFALQACDKLLELGVVLSPASAGGVPDFARQAAVRVGQEPPAGGAPPNPQPPRLGSTETPDILACLTLLHAEDALGMAQDNGAKGKSKAASARAQQAAACLAWRNGFRETGPRSRFNEVVHRMHKFTDWVNRAVDRPGFTSNPGKAALNVAKSVAGVNLSPMSAMKFGLAGADLGLAPVGKQKFEDALADAQTLVRDALGAQIWDINVDEKRVPELALRYAIVDHWKRNIGPRKDVTLDAAARQEMLAFVAEFGVTVKANHPLLKRKLNLKTLEQWGKEALAASPTEALALSAEIATARAHAKATVAKLAGQPTAKELEDLALHALTHTEGVNFRHQGTLGADLVLGFGFNTGDASFAATLGPQLKYGRSKQSSIRVGSSSAGSELFMATDRRHAGQVGAMARLGAEIDVGVADATLGGRLALQAYGREESHEAGVSIRMPKGSTNQKAVAGEVVKFMFRQARQRREGTAISGPQLWERFAQTFAANTELSINYQTNDGTVHRTGGSAALAARVGSGDSTAGPTASVAGEYGKVNVERREPEGRLMIDQSHHGMRKTVQAQAGLSGTLPSIAVSMGIVDEIKFANPGLGQYRMDFTVGGEQGQVRLAIENGKVNPRVSLAYHEHRSKADYFKRLESRRDAWEAAMAADPRGGDGALNDYIGAVNRLDIAGRSAGNRVYMDRNRLTPQAARQLDVLLGDAALLKRQGNDAAAHVEIERLDREIGQVLKTPASWTPDRLAVFEVEAHTVDKGLDAILSARTKMQAASNKRYLAELRLPGEYKLGSAPAAGSSAMVKQRSESLMTSASLESNSDTPPATNNTLHSQDDAMLGKPGKSS